MRGIVEADMADDKKAKPSGLYDGVIGASDQVRNILREKQEANLRNRSTSRSQASASQAAPKTTRPKPNAVVQDDQDVNTRQQGRLNERNRILGGADRNFDDLAKKYPEAAEYIRRQQLELRNKTFLGKIPDINKPGSYWTEPAEKLVRDSLKKTTTAARFKHAAGVKANLDRKLTKARVTRAGVKGAVGGAVLGVAATKGLEMINDSLSKKETPAQAPAVPKVPIRKAVESFQPARKLKDSKPAKPQNMSKLLGIPQNSSYTTKQRSGNRG